MFDVTCAFFSTALNVLYCTCAVTSHTSEQYSCANTEEEVKQARQKKLTNTEHIL